MRTRRQEQYRYNGLSPREFAERTGQSEDGVRRLIASGWFGWTEDGKLRVPECLDVRKVGGQRAEYRIHPNAVQRYYRERAVDGREAA